MSPSQFSIDWFDVVIRETVALIITARTVPSESDSGAYSIEPDSRIIGYHAVCRAHYTSIEIDEGAAQRIKSTAFCPLCRVNAPEVKIELSPESKILNAILLHERLEYSMYDFIESLELDDESDTAWDDRMSGSDSQEPFGSVL